MVSTSKPTVSVVALKELSKVKIRSTELHYGKRFWNLTHTRD